MNTAKKIISLLIAVALVLTALPMSFVTSGALDERVDESLKLSRPMANIYVSPITRVAYAQDSMKAPTGSNSVIVKSTPSGIPYLSSGKTTLAYAGETPTATVVTFTPGVLLDEQPVLSCSNATVKWTGPLYSNGTYTWTVTSGSAVIGSTIVFDVSYVYSEVNSVTGKEYTNTYVTSGTTYIEPIATPVGIYTNKRTYEDWGFGTTTKNRSYVASYILGQNTYGSIYNGGTPDGSVAFTQAVWSASAAGWTAEYGMMKAFSGSTASKNFNVAYRVDTNRPYSTVYFDTSINSTLSDLNLRMISTSISESDEADEIVTVSVESIDVLAGNSDTLDGSNEEYNITSDDRAKNQLNITKPTGSVKAIGTPFYSYFTGLGPNTENSSTEYTIVSRYKTSAGWSGVYVTHSYTMRIVTYDKGALRSLIENVQSLDPDVMTTDIAENGYKGYNPQSWYYASGWENFYNALNTARGFLNKPDTTQAEIDEQYNALKDAYNNLRMSTADYTVAAAYYNQATGLDPNNYTLASWARLQTVLDNYCSNYSALYQPAVDKLASDIKAAMDALEYRYADYTEFNAHLTTVNNLIRRAQTVFGKPVENVYAGWENVVSVLNKSGCVYNELDGYIVEDMLLVTEQATVNGYVLLIETALNKLYLKGADYTQAKNAEDAYKVIKISYVSDDIAPSLTAAYNALVALHGLDVSYQSEIDSATENLNYWLSRVTYKPANITAAQNLIQYAYSLDRTQYNDFTAVDTAIANLQSKLSLDIRYQSEIDRAVDALQSAIDSLLRNLADYTLVDLALETVADIERDILEEYEDTYGFTASTFYSNWASVVSAVDSVVRGLEAESQSRVDGFATMINNAISNLRENPADYSSVTALQNSAYSIVTTGSSIYTRESLDNLLNAYADVDNTLTISEQATVDGYADAIQQAIDDLEYLSADYSSVNTQVALAESKIAANDAYSEAHPGYTLYTSESLADVAVAVAAVVDGLDIRYQSQVDGYASDIDTAIKALVYGPADYTNVYAKLAEVPEDLSIYTTLTATTLTTTVNNINYSYTADKQSTVDGYVDKINTALGKLKLKAADYTEVNKALKRVPTDSSLYTEDSWQALQDQVNAVVTGLDITHQEEVDAMAENLNMALGFLAYKGADYSAVEEAIISIPTDLSIYTDESAAAVETARDAVDYYCNITQQSIVDGYASAINSAVAALELKPADYTVVESAKTSAQTKINSGLYTDESVNAVLEKINAVVEGLDITHQDEVYEMAQAIKDAADAMVYKDADYSAVEELVREITEKAESGLYTQESTDTAMHALDTIDWTLNIEHQSEIDEIAQNLRLVSNAMRLKPADYTAVENAKTSAQTKINSGLYTDESVNAVLEKINAVVEGLDITHQDEVNEMAQAINDAAEAMIYKNADYSAVEDAIASIPTDLSIYTDESAAAVEAARDAVDYTCNITQQSTVDGYATAINNAVAALELKPADYTVVENAKTSAQTKINSGLYTDESVNAVLEKINAVVEGLDITHQGEVNEMAQAINDAAEAMIYKNADYSAVEDAIASIPTDLSIYTDESAAAVEAARDAVDYTCNITQQSTVDGYATAINNAVAALELKPADYTAVENAKTSAQTKINSRLYTGESVNAVLEKINAVVEGLDITHQDEVNEMAQAINDAAEAMIYKNADYSAVEELVREITEKAESGLYTQESTDDAMQAVNTIDWTLNIEHQSEIDEIAQILRFVSNAMRLRDADYSALNEAVGEANSKINSGYYTDESVAKLVVEIDKVIYGLDINHQDDVDTWTDSIVKATKDLVLKLADYTELQNILNLLDNSDSEIYTITYSNFNEVMSLITEYRNTTVSAKMDLTIDKQSEVDEMRDVLQGYIDSLVPAATEMFELTGGAILKNGTYIIGLRTGLSPNAFINEYTVSENVNITISNNKSRRTVGTGTIVTVTSASDPQNVIAEYTIVILGDLDGDGYIAAQDAVILKSALTSMETELSGAYAVAADVTGRRAGIDSNDLVMLSNVISQTGTIDQSFTR